MNTWSQNQFSYNVSFKHNHRVDKIESLLDQKPFIDKIAGSSVATYQFLPTNSHIMIGQDLISISTLIFS